MKAGNYKARCVEACLGYTKNGKQQLECLLETEAGEQISAFLSFSGEAAQYTLEKMRAMGWDHGKPLTSLCDNVVDIRVFEEEYNGKTTIKCDVYSRPRGLLTKDRDRMNQTEASKFLAQFAPKEEPRRGW